jgi:hypothetical protein
MAIDCDGCTATVAGSRCAQCTLAENEHTCITRCEDCNHLVTMSNVGASPIHRASEDEYAKAIEHLCEVCRGHLAPAHVYDVAAAAHEFYHRRAQKYHDMIARCGQLADLAPVIAEYT